MLINQSYNEDTRTSFFKNHVANANSELSKQPEPELGQRLQ